jgi:transcriptional regulator with XRE-family HTH domain
MSPLAFDQEQAQKLSEIGAHLRSARTQKGLSLEDVATKTLIQPRFITAIEQGKIEELPEALYVRGFIRRMAEVSGVNGDSLAESFPLGQVQSGSSNAKLVGVNGPTLRPWHLYAIYFALVIGAVALLYSLFKPQEAPRSAGTGKVTNTAAVPKPTKPSPVVKAVAKPQTAPVQAQLTLKADSYLDISVDGQSNFVGTLKAGTKKTITAKQEIRISAGNAGGVVLAVNSQDGKVMGKSGEIKDVTLTPASKGF